MDIRINTKINEKQCETTKITQLTSNALLSEHVKALEKWVNNNPVFSGVDLRGASICDTMINARDNNINWVTLRLFPTNSGNSPRITFILPPAVLHLLRGYNFRFTPTADTTDKIRIIFDTKSTDNINQTYLSRIVTGSNAGCRADDIRLDFLKGSFDGKIYIKFVFGGGSSNIVIRNGRVLFSNILDSTGKRDIKLFCPHLGKYLSFIQTSSLHQPAKSNPHNNPAFLKYFKTGKITRDIFNAYYGVVREYAYKTIDGKLCRDKLLRTLTKNPTYANPKKLVNVLDDGYSIRQFKKHDTEPYDKNKNWIVESKIMPSKTANKPVNKWTVSDLIDSGVKNADLRADILAQIKPQKPASMGAIIDYNPAQGWLIKPNKPLNNKTPMLILLLICPTKQNKYLHFVPERVNTWQFSTPEYYDINTVEKARRLMMFNNVDNGRFYDVIKAGLMDTVPVIQES